jgi:hypothetical protein
MRDSFLTLILTLSPTVCAAGIHPIQQSGKVGFIDETGVIVVAPKYDYAKSTDPQSELIPVRLAAKWGFVDSTGKEVIAPNLQLGLPPMFCGPGAPLIVENKLMVVDRSGTLRPIADAERGFECREGLVPVRANGAWNYFTSEGVLAFPGKFEGALPFSGGFAAVQAKGKWGYIDKSGAFVIDPKFAQAGLHGEGLFPVRMGDLWGFADKTGAVVIEPRFADVSRFADGRAAVAQVLDDGLTRYGFVDTTGKLVVPFQYALAGDFSGARAMVMKNGKFGYIDRDGNIAIPLRYYQARDFRDGLAGVKEKDAAGKVIAMYLDRSGKVVWRGENIP